MSHRPGILYLDPLHQGFSQDCSQSITWGCGFVSGHSLGRVHFPAPSHGSWWSSAPWGLLDRGPQFFTPWGLPSVTCPAGLCVERLTTRQLVFIGGSQRGQSGVGRTQPGSFCNLSLDWYFITFPNVSPLKWATRSCPPSRGWTHIHLRRGVVTGGRLRGSLPWVLEVLFDLCLLANPHAHEFLLHLPASSLYTRRETRRTHTLWWWFRTILLYPWPASRGSRGFTLGVNLL